MLGPIHHCSARQLPYRAPTEGCGQWDILTSYPCNPRSTPRICSVTITIPALHLSEGTKLSLYTDDILLYKTISSFEDYIHLRHDIDQIHSWSTTNLMTFNPSNCMFVSRKRNVNPLPMHLNTHAPTRESAMLQIPRLTPVT